MVFHGHTTSGDFFKFASWDPENRSNQYKTHQAVLFCWIFFLAGGWTNPFEKYARQIGNLPQLGVNISNIWNHHFFRVCFFRGTNKKAGPRNVPTIFRPELSRFGEQKQIIIYTPKATSHTVDGRNPANQLRLVVYQFLALFTMVLYIPGSVWFLPSTDDNGKMDHLKLHISYYCWQKTPKDIAIRIFYGNIKLPETFKIWIIPTQIEKGI